VHLIDVVCTSDLCYNLAGYKLQCALVDINDWSTFGFKVICHPQ